jgi:hypothetical protein
LPLDNKNVMLISYWKPMTCIFLNFFSNRGWRMVLGMVRFPCCYDY